MICANNFTKILRFLRIFIRFEWKMHFLQHFFARKLARVNYLLYLCTEISICYANSKRHIGVC